MKKLLFFMALILPLAFLSSCSKDEKLEPTTYTIHLSDVGTTSLVTINITAFEYNAAGEKISYHDWNSAKKDSKQTFTASDNAEKVKIYISLSSTSKKWVQQVFYLKSGNNLDINITGSTKMGVSEP